ncbi:MAG: hypothetical protein Q9195_003512 [Heterodermia aff. obscurata]
MYKILRWFGNILGEGSQGKERGTQGEQGILSAPNDSSPDLPPSQSASEGNYAFTEENKIAVMENIVSILLTEDTLRFMAKIIMESKACQNYEIEYEEAKRKAALGEAYVKGQHSKMDDANLAEDSREQARQAMEDARPRVLEDNRRCATMKRELGTRKANLEDSRGKLDDLMEQLMTDVGVFERPAPEHQADEGRTFYDEESREKYPHQEEVSESNSTEDTPREPRTNQSAVSTVNSSARTYESTVSGTDSIAWAARVRLEAAANRAILAEDHFNRRHEEYLEDVRDRGHDHSRTEIDHYWFRRGAKLARELIDAEEEYDQARAEAKALDLLANSPGQEFDFADEEDDGYRESEDPICDVDQVDRAFIEAWLNANVQEEQEEPNPVEPVIEWEAESVNMSDSVSAINGCVSWRKAIDKWHSQQESLRAQFVVLPENEQ